MCSFPPYLEVVFSILNPRTRHSVVGSVKVKINGKVSMYSRKQHDIRPYPFRVNVSSIRALESILRKWV
jgi:hypothetical protein